MKPGLTGLSGSYQVKPPAWQKRLADDKELAIEDISLRVVGAPRLVVSEYEAHFDEAERPVRLNWMW